MNELRPEIAPLAAAVTDEERARALIRMSYSALMTCEFTIRNRLRVAGFGAGLDFLEAALVAMRSQPDEFGVLDYETLKHLTERRVALAEIAAGGAGHGHS